MTEDRVPTLNAITEHIDREARRIGTYHGDPAATPGGTGYCIPAAVATQIVDKYLSAQPAPPLDVVRLDDAALMSLASMVRHQMEVRGLIGSVTTSFAARLGSAPSRSDPE